MVRFTRKKIESMTLGEKMKKIRNERRLSLNEISSNTRIQVRHLEYLEEGNYSKLPADVYVRGFLKNYASYMRLDGDKLIKKYERERKIEKNIKKEEQNEGINNPVKFSTFIITPRIIIISIISIFLVLGIFYLYRGIDNFIANPRLAILSPLDGSDIEGRSARIKGIAEKDSKVFINEQPVLVNEEGEFSESIGLQEGSNVILVKAVNKFDKESEHVLSVNAIYENEDVESDFENNISKEGGEISNVEIELYVNPDPTWVSVEADGTLMYSGVLSPDSSQKFDAKNRIIITSGNGSKTFVKFNGNEFEVLEDQATVVRDIVFTPDGRVQE